MTEQERQYYIDWLLLYYPFKAASYFKYMTDQQLLMEFERMNENL